MKEMIEPCMHLIDNAKKAVPSVRSESRRLWPSAAAQTAQDFPSWDCPVRTLEPAVMPSTAHASTLPQREWIMAVENLKNIVRTVRLLIRAIKSW